jgi:hypothetical protein
MTLHMDQLHFDGDSYVFDWFFLICDIYNNIDVSYFSYFAGIE